MWLDLQKGLTYTQLRNSTCVFTYNFKIGIGTLISYYCTYVLCKFQLNSLKLCLLKFAESVECTRPLFTI